MSRERETPSLERLREMERLFASKNECSPAVHKAGRELLRAYQEAEIAIRRLAALSAVLRESEEK